MALSCGGLIASLRELGQSITILTVYSGTGDRDGDATDTSAKRSVSGRRDSGQTLRRSTVVDPRRLAQCGARANVGADDDQLEATQTDADASAKRFWQRSSWYRRASIRNESLAGQMVIDDCRPRVRVHR